GMVEDAELSSRDIGFAHRLLGKHFTRLELSRSSRGAEDAQAGLLEMVHDAQGQRFLGTNDGQANIFLPREAEQMLKIGYLDRYIDPVLSRACISGCTIDALNP